MVDWALLSNVGQSYGGISALVSGVALIAAIRANILQQDQTRIAQHQHALDVQARIIQNTIESNELKQTFEAELTAEQPTASQHAFITLRFRTLQFRYLIEELDDKQLRLILQEETFISPMTRWYWANLGPMWGRAVTSSRQRNFVKIADSALAEAMPDEPPTPS